MAEGLREEDLIGLVDVVLKKSIQSKSLPDTLVFTVEHNGREYRIGVIGKQALESVKKHGYKDANGKVHLRIPSTALREEGAGWINTAY
jgi:hypothetical protein